MKEGVSFHSLSCSLSLLLPIQLHLSFRFRVPQALGPSLRVPLFLWCFSALQSLSFSGGKCLKYTRISQEQFIYYRSAVIDMPNPGPLGSFFDLSRVLAFVFWKFSVQNSIIPVTPHRRRAGRSTLMQNFPMIIRFLTHLLRICFSNPSAPCAIQRTPQDSVGH